MSCGAAVIPQHACRAGSRPGRNQAWCNHACIGNAGFSRDSAAPLENSDLAAIHCQLIGRGYTNDASPGYSKFHGGQLGIGTVTAGSINVKALRLDC